MICKAFAESVQVFNDEDETLQEGRSRKSAKVLHSPGRVEVCAGKHAGRCHGRKPAEPA